MLDHPPKHTLLEEKKAHRLHYLDWARVFAFSLLIVYHTGLIFVGWPWHIKSEVRSDSIAHLLNFITQWRIPLLFFISGAGTALAYKGKYLSFLHSRVQRILVPLFVAMLTILPLQYLLERHWQGVPLQFLLENPFSFFTGKTPIGNFNLFHLWYLWDLWKISLVMVPALYFIQKYTAKLWSLTWFRKAFLTVGFGILFMLEAAPALEDFRWVVLFGYGFLMFRNMEYFPFARPWVAAAIALTAYAILAVWFWEFDYTSMPPLVAKSVLKKWLFRFLLTVNVTASVYALIGLFKQYFNVRNARIDVMNRVIVPIYILHQLIIMALGYCFIQFCRLPWICFFVIQLIFWPLAIGICVGVLGRFRTTKVLFGIR